MFTIFKVLRQIYAIRDRSISFSQTMKMASITLYNVRSVPGGGGGVLSTVGDIRSTVEDVHYCWGYYEYRGGYLEYCGGYLEYCGGHSVS